MTTHQSGVLNAVADRGRELDVAATKIQARYRGHKLRRTKKQEYHAASKVQVRVNGCACACLPLSLVPHSKREPEKKKRAKTHNTRSNTPLPFARPTRGTVASAVVVLVSTPVVPTKYPRPPSMFRSLTHA